MRSTLQNQRMIFLGFKLPLLMLWFFVLLIMVGFTSSNVSSFIFIDKLILINVILIPITCVSGVVISITAAVKSEVKLKALAATVLNIVLLIVCACVSKPFFVEFKLAF